jgi:hypothetical protein
MIILTRDTRSKEKKGSKNFYPPIRVKLVLVVLLVVVLVASSVFSKPPWRFDRSFEQHKKTDDCSSRAEKSILFLHPHHRALQKMQKHSEFSQDCMQQLQSQFQQSSRIGKLVMDLEGALLRS